jgi:alpha/beta superfamily hydrolase
VQLQERDVDLTSDGLSLEARFHAGDAPLAAIIAHPHPQYGGDMDNHVVIAIAETLASLGASTLRFNVRGAGRSSGTYDNGLGETEDCRAALVKLRVLCPSATTIAVGYSFGGMMVANIADGASVDAIVLVSPPKVTPLSDDLETLIVVGSDDPISSASAARALATAHHHVAIVEGADHGWWPGIDELCDHVRTFARRVAASHI